MPSFETRNFTDAVTMARMIAQKKDVERPIAIPGLVSGLSRAIARITQVAKIETVQMVVCRRQTGTNSYLKTCKGCGERVVWICGLTFELTLTAEAGAVRPGDDDGTHWRCPALQRLP